MPSYSWLLTDPPSFGNVTPGTQNAFTYGNNFQVTANGYLNGLRWYRSVTGSTVKTPTRMALWRRDTGALVFDAPAIPDSGTVGWQTVFTSTSVALSTGIDYVVALYYPAGGGMPFSTALPSSVPGDFTKHVNFVSYYAGNGIPTTAYDPDPETIAVDAQWSDSPATGGGNTGQGTIQVDTSQQFVAWLADTNDNTHRAGDSVPGLPDTTKVVVDAISGDTTAIAAEVDGLHAKISADGVTWDAKLGPLQAYGGVTSLGISAGVDIVRTDVASKASQTSLDAAATEVSAIAASVALALALRRNALVDFPSSPWVMTDETAFDTDIAYTEEADLYVVTFTDLGSNLVNTVVAGVDVSYRLAWWAPLIGAFAQQRRFVDTPSAHLWLDGTRLPGVLLHSPAGAAGTIQAWTYA